MTEQQIKEFNSMYLNACDKMKGLLILENHRPKAIGFFEKIRANKAIKYFNDALSIIPDHFASLFFIGKIYQRLGNYDQALLSFDKALNSDQVNSSVALEASLVAMHLKQIDKAIEYSKEGLRRDPENTGILGNHSMNLLIAGFDKEATDTIDKAILLNPADKINQRIKEKIQSVTAGQIDRPTFEESIT